MQVKWLKKALQNFEDEAKYIAQDNPAAARLIAQRIVKAVNLLPDNPAPWPPWPYSWHT